MPTPGAGELREEGFDVLRRQGVTHGDYREAAVAAAPPSCPVVIAPSRAFDHACKGARPPDSLHGFLPDAEQRRAESHCSPLVTWNANGPQAGGSSPGGWVCPTGHGHATASRSRLSALLASDEPRPRRRSLRSRSAGERMRMLVRPLFSELNLRLEELRRIGDSSMNQTKAAGLRSRARLGCVDRPHPPVPHAL